MTAHPDRLPPPDEHAKAAEVEQSRKALDGAIAAFSVRAQSAWPDLERAARRFAEALRAQGPLVLEPHQRATDLEVLRLEAACLHYADTNDTTLLVRSTMTINERAAEAKALASATNVRPLR